jgi:hypothetical protein
MATTRMCRKRPFDRDGDIGSTRPNCDIGRGGSGRPLPDPTADLGTLSVQGQKSGGADPKATLRVDRISVPARRSAHAREGPITPALVRRELRNLNADWNWEDNARQTEAARQKLAAAERKTEEITIATARFIRSSLSSKGPLALFAKTRRQPSWTSSTSCCRNRARTWPRRPP